MLTTPIAEAAEPHPQVQVISIDDLINRNAVKYGVNASRLREVIQCESHFNAKAEGDGHTSIGIAQIHLPDHPEIKKWQAQDPEFAIEWMAKEWAAGRSYQWSCYSIMKSRNWVPLEGD